MNAVANATALSPCRRLKMLGDAIPNTQQMSSMGWAQIAQAMLCLRGSTWVVEDVTEAEMTAHRFMERLSDDVVVDPPDAVIIHLGHSDAAQQVNGQRQWSKDPTVFVESLRESIHRCRAVRPTMTICLMTPVINSIDTSPLRCGPLVAAMQLYTQAIRRLADVEQCLLIDSHTVITDAKLRRDDEWFGPNPRGLDIWGQLQIAELVATACDPIHGAKPSPFQTGQTVLTIGDSITDASRRSPASQPLGNGFVQYAAAIQAAREPLKQVHWINRGIGGNTIVDIASRWDADVLAHRPDWLAIGTGINDLNVRYRPDAGDGIEPERFANVYDEVLARTRRALPQIQLLVMGPFHLTRCVHPGSYNEQVRRRLPGYITAARQIAAKHHARFLDTDALFQRLVPRFGYRALGPDFVHPEGLGVLALAEAWLTALTSDNC